MFRLNAPSKSPIHTRSLATDTLLTYKKYIDEVECQDLILDLMHARSNNFTCTVNPEKFARILFTRIAVKDILTVKLKFCDCSMIDIRSSENGRVISPFCEGFTFAKLPICEVSRK